MRTVLLDVAKWDLVLDVSGNIAVAGEPYALAQDAASAIRTFLGEAWYNTTLGVPYFGPLLGRAPNIALMKAKFAEAARTVPGVTSATVFIASVSGRRVSGQVQITDSSGITTAAAF